MKSPTVRLKIRVRLPDGSRPFLDPVPTGSGKLKSLYALVHGQPEHHPEGVYFLRFADPTGKRVWERVGKDWQLALDARLKRSRVVAAEAVGVQVVHDTEKRRVSDAIAEYNAEIKTHKSKRTYNAYRLTLALFQDATSATYLEDITRGDILTFIAALREDENGPRTVSNRVRYLSTFLRHFQRALPLEKKDKPRYTRKRARAYQPDDLQTLFSRATREEAELLHFFLCTGTRDGEVQHAGWDDLNFGRKAFYVEEKLELNWSPKDREEGSIPLPDYFVEMMKARRARVKGRLIFPDVDGYSRLRYLPVLKSLALRSGLNCGNCFDAKGHSCATHPCCRLWILHRFRKTFATMHRDAGVDLHTIQRWLRHSSLDQTVLYLADSEDQSPVIRNLVNSTFAAFVDHDTVIAAPQ
jgi:integrase/recombinase XerD